MKKRDKRGNDNDDFGFKLTGEFGVVDEVAIGSMEATRRAGTRTEEYPYQHPDFPLPGLNFNYEKIRAEYERQGLFNGYRITADPTDEKVAAAKPEKHFLILDLLRADNDWNTRPKYKKQFKSYHEYLEFYFDRFLAQMKKYPETVWGDCMGEIENSRPWPEDFFRNKKEAYQYWKWSQMERSFGDDPGKNHHYLINFEMEYFKRHGVKLKDANLMIAGCAEFSCHYYFEWGFRLIWMETLAQQHHQDGIAFFRGAARQHGGLWGLDNASHHPHFNATTWYDGQGRRRRGYTASITLRNWMVSFLSGACILHQQASELSHFVYDRKGNFKLSPHGKNAKRFADFALRDHADRGRTEAPIALFLNYHHGYNSRQSCLEDRPNVWMGRMPFSSADANITNFLNLFFPGHDRPLSVWENVWNPKAPWKDQHEWAQMIKDGKDMRPSEEYCLTASPYGDSMDVLLDNAGSEVLAGYKMVILAGEQELGRAQVKRLLDYVRAGGTIITSLAQIPPEMAKPLGIVGNGGDWDYGVTTCAVDGKTFTGRRYGYTLLKIRKGKVVGRNHKKDALLWEIPYGKGRVVLSAVPYSQDISSAELLPLCAHVYGQYIDGVIPAKADPATLQLIVNRGKDFLLIGAFNNFSKPWKGVIRVRDAQGARQVEDIWNKSKAVLKNGSISSTIKPYDFVVYRIAL